MLRTATLVISLSFTTTALHAPTLPEPAQFPDGCGTRLDAANAALARALNDSGLYLAPLPESTLDVPLALHIVRRSDGSGGIDNAQLIAAISNLNDAFTQSGLSFYIVGPTDEIRSDFFYTGITSSAAIDALRSTNRVRNAINIYFTDSFSSSAGPLCGIASFSFSPVQGIVMANGCAGVSYNRATFPHEIGHYFDLFHTHETMFGLECTSGVNCHTAGDLVCDTPADPHIGYHNMNGGCTYVGREIDPCSGTPTYNPDVLNIMSAAPRLCRTRFSPGQTQRMLATLVTLRPGLITHCRADLDRSGSLDIFDFLLFQTMFTRADPAADLNLDTRFDI
ncbi:MAG: hypothetical protein IID31_10020, partial [Planctomycetes bacterium]|nr:hypothetical protein [Planctomycetota bacterium]